MRRLRGCLAAVGAVALCLAALAGGIWYRVEVAPTEVLTDVSPDGMYELTIDRVGEPDWPFGATHCRFTLHGEGRQILERAFSIQDDGAVARADNFAVRWRADGVQVTVSGSEQGDRVYVASEEVAIRVMAPDVEQVYAPAGGEPVIIRVKEGAY